MGKLRPKSIIIGKERLLSNTIFCPFKSNWTTFAFIKMSKDFNRWLNAEIKVKSIVFELLFSIMNESKSFESIYLIFINIKLVVSTFFNTLQLSKSLTFN